MKRFNFSEHFYNKYLLLIFICSLIVIIFYMFYQLNNKTNKLNKLVKLIKMKETFKNEKKIIIDNNQKQNMQLNCVEKDGKFICDKAVPEKVIVNKNYPQLSYETGLSPIKQNGYISFKHNFNSHIS